MQQEKKIIQQQSDKKQLSLQQKPKQNNLAQDGLKKQNKQRLQEERQRSRQKIQAQQLFRNNQQIQKQIQKQIFSVISIMLESEKYITLDIKNDNIILKTNQQNMIIKQSIILENNDIKKTFNQFIFATSYLKDFLLSIKQSFARQLNSIVILQMNHFIQGKQRVQNIMYILKKQKIIKYVKGLQYITSKLIRQIMKMSFIQQNKIMAQIKRRKNIQQKSYQKVKQKLKSKLKQITDYQTKQILSLQMQMIIKQMGYPSIQTKQQIHFEMRQQVNNLFEFYSQGKLILIQLSNYKNKTMNHNKILLYYIEAILNSKSINLTTNTGLLIQQYLSLIMQFKLNQIQIQSQLIFNNQQFQKIIQQIQYRQKYQQLIKNHYNGIQLITIQHKQEIAKNIILSIIKSLINIYCKYLIQELKNNNQNSQLTIYQFLYQFYNKLYYDNSLIFIPGLKLFSTRIIRKIIILCLKLINQQYGSSKLWPTIKQQSNYFHKQNIQIDQIKRLITVQFTYYDQQYESSILKRQNQQIVSQFQNLKYAVSLQFYYNALNFQNRINYNTMIQQIQTNYWKYLEQLLHLKAWIRQDLQSPQTTQHKEPQLYHYWVKGKLQKINNKLSQFDLQQLRKQIYDQNISHNCLKCEQKQESNFITKDKILYFCFQFFYAKIYFTKSGNFIMISDSKGTAYSCLEKIQYISKSIRYINWQKFQYMGSYGRSLNLSQIHNNALKFLSHKKNQSTQKKIYTYTYNQNEQFTIQINQKGIIKFNGQINIKQSYHYENQIDKCYHDIIKVISSISKQNNTIFKTKENFNENFQYLFLQPLQISCQNLWNYLRQYQFSLNLKIEALPNINQPLNKNQQITRYPLKILNWNVYHKYQQKYNTKQRCKALIAHILQRLPDIIVLQELGEFLAEDQFNFFHQNYIKNNYYYPTDPVFYTTTRIYIKNSAYFVKMQFDMKETSRPTPWTFCTFKIGLNNNQYTCMVQSIHLKAGDQNNRRQQQLNIISKTTQFIKPDFIMLAGDFNFGDQDRLNASHLQAFQDFHLLFNRTNDINQQLWTTIKKGNYVDKKRFDRIIFQYCNIQHNKDPLKLKIRNFKRIGLHPVKPFSDNWKKMGLDSIIRGPSDHLGIYSEFYFPVQKVKKKKKK